MDLGQKAVDTLRNKSHSSCKAAYKGCYLIGGVGGPARMDAFSSVGSAAIAGSALNVIKRM